MDNQDQYIKMVFQNAVEQIRAFGATLEQLQTALIFNQEPVRLISIVACIGDYYAFENLKDNGFNATPNTMFTDDSNRSFFYNGINYVNVNTKMPKGYYPDCDKILLLGGYLTSEYQSIINDLEDQKNAFIITPSEFLKLLPK